MINYEDYIKTINDNLKFPGEMGLSRRMVQLTWEGSDVEDYSSEAHARDDMKKILKMGETFKKVNGSDPVDWGVYQSYQSMFRIDNPVNDEYLCNVLVLRTLENIKGFQELGYDGIIWRTKPMVKLAYIGSKKHVNEGIRNMSGNLHGVMSVYDEIEPVPVLKLTMRLYGFE